MLWVMSGCELDVCIFEEGCISDNSVWGGKKKRAVDK